MDGWLTAILSLLVIGFAVLWRRESLGRKQVEKQWRLSTADLEKRLDQRVMQTSWLSLAASAADDPLLVADHQLWMRYANPAAQQLFGPLDQTDSLIGYTHNLELELMATDVADFGDPEGLVRVIRIDDQPFQARALVQNGVVGISLTDVAELQRLSRARQDFVTNISHELRTPLTSLKLLVDTLLGPGKRDRKIARKISKKIGTEVDSLQQMAEEMLDLAAIESGQQVLRLIPYSAKEVIQEAQDRLEEYAERKDIQIYSDIDPGFKILADPEQAVRAVLNVLHNALKFSPEGGEISIGCYSDTREGKVILTIMDSGPGINPKERERIFERFFRGDEARGTPGTGLGLAIAKHIMGAHGGRIGVENRGTPEQGSIFSLTFRAP
jgi:two-component system phosphate regulon sensor histidine kinase PhoR